MRGKRPEPSWQRSRYCSTACTAVALREEGRKRRGIRRCIRCAAALPWRRKHKAKWCKPCRRWELRRLASEKPKKPRPTATCEECGQRFAIGQSAKGRFCSVDCANRNLNPTSIPFVPKPCQRCGVPLKKEAPHKYARRKMCAGCRMSVRAEGRRCPKCGASKKDARHVVCLACKGTRFQLGGVWLKTSELAMIAGCSADAMGKRIQRGTEVIEAIREGRAHRGRPRKNL